MSWGLYKPALFNLSEIAPRLPFHMACFSSSSSPNFLAGGGVDLPPVALICSTATSVPATQLCAKSAFTPVRLAESPILYVSSCAGPVGAHAVITSSTPSKKTDNTPLQFCAFTSSPPFASLPTAVSCIANQTKCCIRDTSHLAPSQGVRKALDWGEFDAPGCLSGLSIA